MNLREKKVLVTGANGFVGDRLCAELIRQNFSVKAAARNFNDFNHHLEKILVPKIDSSTDWSSPLVDVDVVIHLAARVHVMNEVTEGLLARFLEVNLHGTANLARQAAAASVRRFTYVSSIKVNGEHTDAQSFTESNQANPQDPYGVSKWQAEQALHEISKETGMEVVIVRPSLVYGPGVKANFAKLLSTVSKGIPLPLANIRNARSMIYVDNLVDALITCATHPDAAGKTYLLSDGQDVSTPELVRALAIALHKADRVFPVPLSLMRGVAKLLGRSAAVDRLTQSLVVDSSRIRNELGWQPPYTMAQGLQATADWYLQSIRSKRA